MNVCEWLEQVKKLDELINANIAEREQVWAMLTSMTTAESDGMPHAKGGVSDPVGNGVVKLQILAEKIDSLIDQYVDLKETIVSTLKKLEPREYAVLHRYYIRYMTIEDIAEDMGYCERQVSRIKKNALKNLEDVLECHAIQGV